MINQIAPTQHVGVWDDISFEYTAREYLNGKSCGIIAQELTEKFNKSFSRNAVIGKLKRNKIVRSNAKPLIGLNSTVRNSFASNKTRFIQTLNKKAISKKVKKTKPENIEESVLELAVLGSRMAFLRKKIKIGKSPNLKEYAEELAIKEAEFNALAFRKGRGNWKRTCDAVSERRFNQCNYPIGDVGADDFHYCPENKMTGSSYCEKHRELCRGKY